jgi:lipopolysaccharide/colanic/teichoic acid biosynthesis glycosyltransferase
MDATMTSRTDEMPRAHVRSTPTALFAKRLFDIIAASVLVIVFAPVMAIVAIAIRLTSRGPVLHRYEMVGEGGRTFWGQKFRTMIVNAHAMRAQIEHMNEMKGPVFKVKNDPRVTSIGRWLRKYSLDELPQLWSVVKGDLSLVGPRPPGPYEADEFDDWRRDKLKVKPGMTSLWVVRGKPSDFDEWVRLDIEYINNWSLWLDMVILAKTLPIVLLGRNC